MRRINSLRHWLLLPVVFATTVSAFADTRFERLVQKSTRPTVAEVEALLREEPITQAPDGSHLPKVDDKPEQQLQNNFALWSNEIKKRAAHMIVTFEKNLPGVNYVFVGRDMAIIADLFEGFYRSIGQPDRVIRVGMSSGTLPSLSNEDGIEQTIRFLESSGMKIEANPSHPSFFVDAISRGGGRQIRFLLKNIYQKLVSQSRVSLGEAVLKYNAVGLSVYTTSENFADLTKAESYFEDLEQSASNVSQTESIADAKFNLMVYRDGRAAKSFVGINEAGYTHWTGAWHESYGPLHDEEGKSLATPGELATDEVRTALLKFQAVIVAFAQSTEFQAQIMTEAARQGFAFPMHRPTTILNLRGDIRKGFEKATNFEDRLAVHQHLSKVSLGSSKLQAVGLAFLQSTMSDPHSRFDQILQAASHATITEDLAIAIRSRGLGHVNTWEQFRENLAEADELFRQNNVSTGAGIAEVVNLARRQLSFDGSSFEKFQQLFARGPVNPESLEDVLAHQLAIVKTFAEAKEAYTQILAVYQSKRLNMPAADASAQTLLARFGSDAETRLFVAGLPFQKQATAEQLVALTPAAKRLGLLQWMLSQKRIDPTKFGAIVLQQWAVVETTLIAQAQQNSVPAIHESLRSDLRILFDSIGTRPQRASVLRRAIATSLTADEYLEWLGRASALGEGESSLLITETSNRFFSLKPKPAQVNQLMRLAPGSAKTLVVQGIRNAASLEEANALDNRGNLVTQPEEVKVAMKELKDRLAGNGGKNWMFWKNAQVRCEMVF